MIIIISDSILSAMTWYSAFSYHFAYTYLLTESTCSKYRVRYLSQYDFRNIDTAFVMLCVTTDPHKLGKPAPKKWICRTGFLNRVIISAKYNESSRGIIVYIEYAYMYNIIEEIVFIVCAYTQAKKKNKIFFFKSRWLDTYYLNYSYQVSIDWKNTLYPGFSASHKIWENWKHLLHF